MAVVLISLQQIPLAVRMDAITAARRDWDGEPDELLLAALVPSDVKYRVDEEAYREAREQWAA